MNLVQLGHRRQEAYDECPMLRVKTLLLVPVLGLAFAGCGEPNSPSFGQFRWPDRVACGEPTSVPEARTSTLTWSSTDALPAPLRARGRYQATSATSLPARSPRVATTFLTCNDSSGGSGSASATVTVPGTPRTTTTTTAGCRLRRARSLSRTAYPQHSAGPRRTPRLALLRAAGRHKAPTGSESTSALDDHTLFNLTCGPETRQ